MNGYCVFIFSIKLKTQQGSSGRYVAAYLCAIIVNILFNHGFKMTYTTWPKACGYLGIIPTIPKLWTILLSCFPFAAMKIFTFLQRLSPSFWAIAMGICAHLDARAQEVWHWCLTRSPSLVVLTHSYVWALCWPLKFFHSKLGKPWLFGHTLWIEALSY